MKSVAASFINPIHHYYRHPLLYAVATINIVGHKGDIHIDSMFMSSFAERQIASIEMIKRKLWRAI